MCFGFLFKPQPPRREDYPHYNYDQYLRDYDRYQKDLHQYKKKKRRRGNPAAGGIALGAAGFGAGGGGC